MMVSNEVELAFAREGRPMHNVNIVIEEHDDGFVAYPLGMNGVVIGQGDTAEDALKDVKSAIGFHIGSFGKGAFADTVEVLSARLAEAELAE
jgi:predicted RNase H-like HicB family nuclease